MDITPRTTRASKRCSLLRRRPDLGFQSFAEHWAGPHAAIATTMPGIARYTQNRVRRELWSCGTGFACDGVVELEFRDEAAMHEAGTGNAVRTLLPEDELRFISAITLCQVPAGARQVWPEMEKIVVAGCLAPDGSYALLKQALSATGCVEHSIDAVSAAAHRERLDFESDPPHFFATLWFKADCDVACVFGRNTHWDASAGRALRKGAAWLINPLQIVG